MVVDLTYYEALEIESIASPGEIKTAYRRLALKHHPDKNLDDEDAKERFQAVSEAFQVLGDPELRRRYDESGIEDAVPEAGFVHPMEILLRTFGGGAFESWVGEFTAFMVGVRISQEPMEAGPINDVLDNMDDLSRTDLVKQLLKAQSAERKRQQELAARIEETYKKELRERVRILQETLVKRMSEYTDSTNSKDAEAAFERSLQQEAQVLKMEPFGLHFLHVIGEVYFERGAAFIKYQGKFLKDFRQQREAKSAAKSLKKKVSSLEKTIQRSQTKILWKVLRSDMTDAETDELNLAANANVYAAIWNRVRGEAEIVLLDSGRGILYDSSVPLDIRLRRARGLEIIGKVFRSVKRTPQELSEHDFQEEKLVAKSLGSGY